MSNTLPMVHVGIPSVLRNHVRALKLTMSHEHGTTEDNVHKFDISQINAGSNNLDGIIKGALAVLTLGRKPIYLFVADSESLDLLRVLHKLCRIKLNVTFYDVSKCTLKLDTGEQSYAEGKTVEVASNGKLSDWPSSVLDLSGGLLMKLLIKEPL